MLGLADLISAEEDDDEPDSVKSWFFSAPELQMPVSAANWPLGAEQEAPLDDEAEAEAEAGDPSPPSCAGAFLLLLWILPTTLLFLMKLFRPFWQRMSRKEKKEGGGSLKRPSKGYRIRT